MFLRICGNFTSAKSNWARKSQKIYKSQKYVIRKSQISKLTDLQKFRKYKKIKSANLQICGLRNVFADRPPLLIINALWGRQVFMFPRTLI